MVSAFDLDQQVTSDGATWLDQHIVNPSRSPVAGSGFGVEFLDALEKHKNQLIGWGQAGGRPAANSGREPTSSRHSAVRRSSASVGSSHLSGALLSIPFRRESVRGKLLGSVQLASGRFAMIDDGLGFSLVPWRPVMEQEVGRCD